MENTKPEGGSTTVNIKLKWREFSIFSFSKKAENNIDKMNKKHSEALRHKQYREGKKAELTKLRALRDYVSKKNPELLRGFETEYDILTSLGNRANSSSSQNHTSSYTSSPIPTPSCTSCTTPIFSSGSTTSSTSDPTSYAYL
jgi:hypothetical protein